MADSPTQTMRATRSRYRPTKELGHGATATVWRARDTETGREVALKRFHPHLVADPVARARIEEEAAAATRVTHPNIVSPIDALDDSDGLALVFPYVKGVTLAQRLHAGRRFKPREAAQVALDVADALAVAHAAGVIHRDVKPANILLGSDHRARLLDFGISRAVDEIDDGHRLTGAGLAIGTLPYMAPEQLAAGPITPASDVYGLGVVLYEMLAARQPYAAASPVTLAQEQLHPPARVAGAPAPLMQLALDAMQPDAALRPDAAQLARALRAWLDGRSEAAAPTVTVAAQPRATARPALGWLAVAVAALLLAIVVPIAAAGWLTQGPGPAGSSVPVVAVAPTPSPTPTTPPPTAAAPAPAAPVHVTPTPPPPPPPHHHHRHHHHRHHHHHH